MSAADVQRDARIGFDPLVGPGGADTDANPTSSDAQGSAAGDASGAGPSGDLCANVITLQAGMPLANQSIAGAGNDYAAGVCGDGPELMFRFVAPTAGMRLIEITPTFDGAFSVGTQCPPVISNCTNVNQGQLNQFNLQMVVGANYFIFDRTTGTGTTYTIVVP